ncbi:hypothetical protein [Frigoribacterium faeni]|uniref:hypothetical protein n=1 Tax=Frigoribacterium faeni TaxID=145483 RepID=UPI00141A7E24|nr:hypothetical protein [Frigoribacterium faeni]NIJ05068.1 hypothetical protein [Frigoribacterium faeni]
MPDALLLLLLLTKSPGAADQWRSASPADWATVVGTFMAVGATVWIAIAVARSSSDARAQDRVHARRLAMTEAHIRLTTGEVASARHLVGTLLNLPRWRQLRRVRCDRENYISAFYTLAWAVESISNLRRTWTSKAHRVGKSDFLSWNEDALFESLDDLYALLVATDVRFIEGSRSAWHTVTVSRACPPDQTPAA